MHNKHATSESNDLAHIFRHLLPSQLAAPLQTDLSTCAEHEADILPVYCEHVLR